ncbi:MAG: hypothetical protein ACP5J5_04985 [Dissulfurimicrobium sp.]|uniref:hypothetical protein n=1 Tax=Dissulfurimicrobium TaxID=1769732 RepID=UPI001ED9D545|nr:hypothetical protein [Dissulfurimicrobium hydrothermale]UKL12874.1 hypothetical protein LGS26_05100 [Dissulfurimicrobium hydrothermale]
MDMTDTMKKVIQELIVPEISLIKADNSEIKAILQLTNKRLDDINIQLSDINRRVDETNKCIDEVRAERYERIEMARSELLNGLGGARFAIENLNMRLDRLYDAVVRRD